MKTWIKRSLIGLGATAVLLGGLAACGSRSHMTGWGNMNEADATQWREKMVTRAAGKLDLDAAQKQRLSTLGEALAAKRQALMPAGSPPRAEFQALISGSNFDRSKAQALVDAKTAAVQTNAPKVVAAAGDFFDSLKPAQQQQLRDLLAKGGRGRHGHRGE